MIDPKRIAHIYGLTDRIEALEKALLSVKGVTEVTFDLTGYFDNIYQVIVIAKYNLDYSEGISDAYNEHSRIQKELVKAARLNQLTRTEDELEDMGEHFYIVFSSSKWNDNREYALFYEQNGKMIPVGSEGWVPTRTIANKLASYHELRKVLEGREILIRERPKQKLCQPMTRYNGHVVYNEDYCYFNALSIGDYVNEGIYNYFVNCMTPACMRADCIQLGEAADLRVDTDGITKTTFRTLKKVAEGVYQYCGKCFRGENIERGIAPSYT